MNQFCWINNSKLGRQWQSHDQILKFLKFKMADGRHVGKYWKYHNSPNNRWGIKISRFYTNKSVYLTNDTRHRHSYYGRRIWTRMRSIKWCHFQWPWTNPNPVFKVTPLFNAKCLTNGYRYGYSYYRRRIGNCTKAFEWHQFQWPWVTSKPDFKVTVLFKVK